MIFPTYRSALLALTLTPSCILAAASHTATLNEFIYSIYIRDDCCSIIWRHSPRTLLYCGSSKASGARLEKPDYLRGCPTVIQNGEVSEPHQDCHRKANRT